MPAAKKYDTNKIRSDFISGQQTLRQLAEQHGCSYSYLASLSSRERWYPQRRDLQRQAEQVASEALLKHISEKSTELAQLEVATREQHVQRSLRIGEGLHAVLQQALAALQAGDTRQLKEATTAWRDWDNQMRKNHGLSDTEAADKPLVNINVMAALPRMDDMKPRQEEQEAVEAEAA